MKKHLNLPNFIALIFLGVGLYIVSASMVRSLTWEKTEGVVIEVKKRGTENQWFPRVEFQTHAGKRVEVDIYQSMSQPEYEQGDAIPLMYPKDDFQEARIDGMVWMWGFPLLVTVFGLVMLLGPSEWFDHSGGSES